MYKAHLGKISHHRNS